MAQSAQSKIVLNGARDIPFNKLLLSQRNVRRIKNGQSIEQLAQDIANRGLIQSLSVRPVRDGEGQETGLYEVPAGGRRFEALKLLVKGKRLAKNAPVPCIVKSDGSPEEDSLAENTMREALHPLDQFRAFKGLIDQGVSEEDVAARFFVTVQVVRQRLKLAAVSPKILDLYAENKIDLQQLMAFTVSNDHARQEQVWERLAQGYNEAYSIRRLLQEHSVSADDRRAIFVGTAPYEAAGGTIARDLFQNHDRGGWFENVPLLDRLVMERLDAVGAEVRAEGWRWVEVKVDFPYGHTAGLRRLNPIKVPLSAEDETRVAALREEYDNLHLEYEGADELPDAVDQRLGEIEEVLEALERQSTRYDLEWVGMAGAFVSLDHSGHARIERGFVRPEDVPAAPERPDPSAEGQAGGDAIGTENAGGSDGAFKRVVFTVGGEPAPAGLPVTEPEEEGERPIPERLMTELTTHRTMGLREALANDPDSAFVAVLHAMTLRLFYPTTGYRPETCLEIQVTSRAPDRTTPCLPESPAANALLRREAAWRDRLPENPKALWDFLLQMDGDSRADLFACCAGMSVNAMHLPNERRPEALVHADRLAEQVGLDMTEHWRPTADNFFLRVTKSRILNAVREAKDGATAQLIEHLKKGDMAREAERLVQGTGWLPEQLRTPGRDDGTMRAVMALATAPIGAEPADPIAPEVQERALPAFLAGDEGAAEAFDAEPASSIMRKPDPDNGASGDDGEEGPLTHDGVAAE